MSSKASIAALAVSLSLSCATTPQGPPADFVATGSFEYRGYGASFNDERVVGSKINVSRRADGTWGGVVRQKPFDVNVIPGHVRGVNINVSWEETPGGVIVDGLFYGRLMHFEVRADQFVAQAGAPVGGFVASRFSKETFAGGLSLKGAASELHPPEPQFALALLGAFR